MKAADVSIGVDHALLYSKQQWHISVLYERSPVLMCQLTMAAQTLHCLWTAVAALVLEEPVRQ